MSGRGGTSLARRAPGRALARALLPRGLHAAGPYRCHRLSEQGGGLRSVVQGRGRDRADDRGRSQAPRRLHRHHRGAPHLGLDHDPPPARAHDRARWWHLARRLTLGVVPAPLLAAGARLLQAVPWADASEAARRPQGRPVAVLRPAYAERKAFAAYLAPLRKRKWYVYSKPPFGGPKAVLAYLSRYTHRVAISNRPLIACDERGVTFTNKDYLAHGPAPANSMTLATAQF